MEITKMWLTVNPYSRPGTIRKRTEKIAVHYVGNPGTTALNNRNYFEGLKNQKPDSTGKYCLTSDGKYLIYNGGRVAIRYVSSNYIVGLDGEVLECVPPEEIAYCTNQANEYSISIECCHPDATGKFTDATETALAELCVYLLKRYGLTAADIIRHYDVTGKQCPLYWSPTKYQPAEVANGRFAAFKNRVRDMLGNAPDVPESVEELPFCVKIIDSALNIRKAPGTSSEVVGVIRGGGIYTIVDTEMVGSVRWGKLKSGIGWISLGEKYVRRI